MRMKLMVAGIALGLTAFISAPRATAQNPDTLMPDESAKKAKALVQELTQALGGPAYMRVRESACGGRLALFDHNGELTGYQVFRDYWRYPDKNRTEYSKKGVIIDLYSGDAGWTLDKSGVTEEPAAAVADFQEQTKKDLDNLLRLRLKEDGIVFRYGGSDTVDLKPADWVEIIDSERRTFRIAIDRETRLPRRMVVVTRNDTTRERTEEMTEYANFHPVDGVQIPKQVSRERDGRRVFQVFFSDCKLNPGLADELFTRASLEKHYAEVGKKQKKK